MKKIQRKLNWVLGPEKTKPSDELKNNLEAFGDKLCEKEKGILRFAGQNINGIKYRKEKLGIEELCSMYEMNIDVMGMMETNVCWSHDARADFIATAGLRFNSSARCVMAGGQSNNEGYLPGGTALISQGKTSGRVMQRGADPLGNFTWMALRGRKETGVLVVNGYRVCQKAGTRSGPDTAYSQIWKKLRKQGDKNPDPRNKCLSDISDLISEWSQKGYHPLV